MKRNLFSFSHDITKIREEILPNISLLGNEEVQNEINTYIDDLPKEVRTTLYITAIGGFLLAFFTDSIKKEAELALNIRDILNEKPFTIHASLNISSCYNLGVNLKPILFKN